MECFTEFSTDQITLGEKRKKKRQLVKTFVKIVGQSGFTMSRNVFNKNKKLVGQTIGGNTPKLRI